jgi:hypothetical protein
MIHGINRDSSIHPSSNVLESKSSNVRSWLNFPWWSLARSSASSYTFRLETLSLRRMACFNVPSSALASQYGDKCTFFVTHCPRAFAGILSLVSPLTFGINALKSYRFASLAPLAVPGTAHLYVHLVRAQRHGRLEKKTIINPRLQARTVELEQPYLSGPTMNASNAYSVLDVTANRSYWIRVLDEL